MPDIRTVDPKTLLLPPSLQSGTVPWKLQRPLRLFGCSNAGMPPIWAEEDSEGNLRILDGVTRAVRMAKYVPGQIVVVEVTEHRKYLFNTTKCVSDVV